MSSKTKQPPLVVGGLVLSIDPAVYLCAIPGRWLVSHSTPSWRIHDPATGFQRIVKPERARSIARTVIDSGRPFPNAITLATKTKAFGVSAAGKITLPPRAKLLVVDGQHRLWAQNEATNEALYPCVIHWGAPNPRWRSCF